MNPSTPLESLRARLAIARREAARAIRSPERTISFRGFLNDEDDQPLWGITGAGGAWHGRYRTGALASRLAVLADPMFEGDAPGVVHLTEKEWRAMVAREVEEGARSSTPNSFTPHTVRRPGEQDAWGYR